MRTAIRFQWFVALALLVLMLEPLISIRNRRRRQTAASQVRPSFLGFLLMATAGTAQPQPAAIQAPPTAEPVAPLALGRCCPDPAS